MKKLIFLAGCMMLCLLGCEGTSDQSSTGDLAGNITLYAGKSVIEADGTYVSPLTVLLMDKSGVEHDVTSEVEIYCNNGDKPIDDADFRTTEEGKYEFYAVRDFDISNTVTVRAVKGVPELPADPDEASIDFRHRMLLVQHTGNECSNCPKMMETLKVLAGDEEYSPLYHHVASHSFNTTDAAYSSAAASLSRELDVHYYPWLTFNLSDDEAYNIDDIKKRIDSYRQDVADAGISAAATVIGNSVYVNIGIKAAFDSKVRVAVWLLEDSVRSTQSGATASWQHMHDNCLRAMSGATKNECIYGKNIGKIKGGESYEFIAAIDDLGQTWNLDNCEVMVIAVSGNGTYDLMNCAVCPLEGEIEYEYL